MRISDWSSDVCSSDLKAGMALALWSMTILVGPVAGPLLGGWISDNYNWPWIFYINVPVGLLAGWASWQLYKHRDSPRKHRPIDTVGLGLLVLWVGALQLLLDKGKELDWFASSAIHTDRKSTRLNYTN